MEREGFTPVETVLPGMGPPATCHFARSRHLVLKADARLQTTSSARVFLSSSSSQIPGF